MLARRRCVLPRRSARGLELLLRWFACAAAASAVGGAALVAMRPALKTGQLKLGAGAARGSPRLAPPRVGAAFSLVPSPRRRRSGVLVCYSRWSRPPRPQTHRASASPATFLSLRLLHGGFHTPGVPRSVRGVQFDVLLNFLIPFQAKKLRRASLSHCSEPRPSSKSNTAEDVISILIAKRYSKKL